MPQFLSGETKVARVMIAVSPSGVGCGAAVSLEKDGWDMATSGVRPFVSSSEREQVPLAVVMPDAPGFYHVWIDVYASDLLLLSDMAPEDVEVLVGVAEFEITNLRVEPSVVYRITFDTCPVRIAATVTNIGMAPGSCILSYEVIHDSIVRGEGQVETSSLIPNQSVDITILYSPPSYRSPQEVYVNSLLAGSFEVVDMLEPILAFLRQNHPEIACLVPPEGATWYISVHAGPSLEILTYHYGSPSTGAWSIPISYIVHGEDPMFGVTATYGVYGSLPEVEWVGSVYNSEITETSFLRR